MSNSISKFFHQGIKSLFYKTPLEGNLVSELISKKLTSKEPVMIARFGSTEIKAVLYPFIPFFFLNNFLKERFLTICL